MSLGARWGLSPFLLLLVVAAPAAAGGIEDGAGLFSQDAKRRAEEIIDEIRHNAHKDLLIATLNQLPEEKLREYQGLKTSAERDRFIHSLATERAQQANLDGVYVLLCRAASGAERGRGLVGLVERILPHRRPAVIGHAVVVWPASNDALFPAADREALDARLAGMGDMNRDQVLLEAVQWTRDRMEANARVQGAGPVQAIQWTAAVWAATSLLALWVVLGLFRARLMRRHGGPILVPSQAPLFGTAAAFWLIEAYRARREPSPPPAPASEPAVPDDVPADTVMHPDDLAALARSPGPWVPEPEQ